MFISREPRVSDCTFLASATYLKYVYVLMTQARASFLITKLHLMKINFFHQMNIIYVRLLEITYCDVQNARTRPRRHLTVSVLCKIEATIKKYYPDEIDSKLFVPCADESNV